MEFKEEGHANDVRRRDLRDRVKRNAGDPSSQRLARRKLPSSVCIYHITYMFPFIPERGRSGCYETRVLVDHPRNYSARSLAESMYESDYINEGDPKLCRTLRVGHFSSGSSSNHSQESSTAVNF